MTFFALKEYLKYKWNAKTRHGVHSPFVFDFVEKVLRDKTPGTLEEKLNAYFSGNTIVWQDATLPEHIALLEKSHTSDEIVIIKNIHENKLANACWDGLSKKEAVTLSIDIYNMGLLFFREEFKVKQHFVLKYPG